MHGTYLTSDVFQAPLGFRASGYHSIGAVEHVQGTRRVGSPLLPFGVARGVYL